MASTLTIRHVSADTHRVLAARAAARGQSLQEFLLASVNELATRPSVDDVLARARARVESTGGVDGSVILDALDADRAR